MKTTSPLWLVLALWGAGLGAAAQFGKISIIFGQAGAIYPLAGPLALGLFVSIVGFPGLILGTTAGLWVQGLGWRRVLMAALTLGAGLSAVQALFPPLPILLALRGLEQPLPLHTEAAPATAPYQLLLALELPQTVDLEIVETAPGIKGASASARNKPATLTTGLVVQVPEYLSAGEKIRIHIEEKRYMCRAD